MFKQKKVAGIDMVKIARFAQFTTPEDAFLKKVFSQNELAYCFSYKDTAPHLAGHFALKEAASKALGTDKYPYIEIEVFHEKNGAPYVCHKGKRLPLAVSLSHTETDAIAIAV